MVLALTALPEITKGALAVLHSEMIPAGLLSNQRLHSISNQQAVVHKLRRFLTTIGWQVETKLIELNAIKAIRARGLKVWLYPFIMMDVPAGNDLPSPDGETHQPVYPWRGRITCYPGPGRPGTADKSAASLRCSPSAAPQTQTDRFSGPVPAPGHPSPPQWAVPPTRARTPAAPPSDR